MNEVERVTMKELSLSLVIRTPFIAPHTRPTANAAITARDPGAPIFVSRYPTVMVASPPMAPMERFIPPTTNATACPRATNTLKDRFRDRLKML